MLNITTNQENLFAIKKTTQPMGPNLCFSKSETETMLSIDPPADIKEIQWQRVGDVFIPHDLLLRAVNGDGRIYQVNDTTWNEAKHGMVLLEVTFQPLKGVVFATLDTRDVENNRTKVHFWSYPADKIQRFMGEVSGTHSTTSELTALSQKLPPMVKELVLSGIAFNYQRYIGVNLLVSPGLKQTILNTGNMSRPLNTTDAYGVFGEAKHSPNWTGGY